MRFVWDPGKAASNVRKHRVTFEEASTVFADPLAVIIADAVVAERTIIVGVSLLSRVVVTVFVELAQDEVRIISARRATKQERRRYEEGEES